jgi:anaerobic selenocysteine-containing dehydrogenase
MPRVVHAPERLTRPLIRRGPRGSGDFAEASWEQALSAVADGLEAVRHSHGTESMLLLGSSGSCRGALHNTGALPRRFLAALCARSSPASSYCAPQGNFSAQASMHANASLFGTQLAGIDPATIRHSALILLWGANLCDTRFHPRAEASRRSGGGHRPAQVENRRAPGYRVGTPRSRL